MRSRPLGRLPAFITAFSILIAPERAELKLLHRAPGRDVFMPPGVDQLEAAPKRRGQTGGVVSADEKAAAPLRSVGREGADDGMSARPQSAPQPDHIGGLVLTLAQKVKGRPVVPNVVRPRRLPDGHVGCNPRDPACLLPHARSRGSKRRRRYIQ